MSSPDDRTEPNPPLLPLRSAVIFLISVVVGATMGVLAFSGGTSVGLSIFAGLAAAGGCLVAANTLIR
ncbi:hypothetical protein ACFV6F_05215 [Kitasatospora phosalacinea]|uniref:hypothetical protein n=1 Tax=Kitasatospora phosalacinea TaxID=2065 RepID=UPI003663136C